MCVCVLFVLYSGCGKAANLLHSLFDILILFHRKFIHFRMAESSVYRRNITRRTEKKTAVSSRIDGGPMASALMEAQWSEHELTRTVVNFSFKF